MDLMPKAIARSTCRYPVGLFAVLGWRFFSQTAVWTTVSGCTAMRPASLYLSPPRRSPENTFRLGPCIDSRVYWESDLASCIVQQTQVGRILREVPSQALPLYAASEAAFSNNL